MNMSGAIVTCLRRTSVVYADREPMPFKFPVFCSYSSMVRTYIVISCFRFDALDEY